MLVDLSKCLRGGMTLMDELACCDFILLICDKVADLNKCSGAKEGRYYLYAVKNDEKRDKYLCILMN